MRALSNYLGLALAEAGGAYNHLVLVLHRRGGLIGEVSRLTVTLKIQSHKITRTYTHTHTHTHTHAKHAHVHTHSHKVHKP